jgi:hypothetical protein
LQLIPCTHPRPPSELDGLLDVVNRHRIRQRGSRLKEYTKKFPSAISGEVHGQ